MSLTPIKQELWAEIEQLPEPQLHEALNYIRSLKWHSDKQPVSDTSPDSNTDPIIQFIGGVSSGLLAQNIDEDLYGS